MDTNKEKAKNVFYFDMEIYIEEGKKHLNIYLSDDHYIHAEIVGDDWRRELNRFLSDHFEILRDLEENADTFNG